MEEFFWCAFGIFFIIASIIGLFVIIYSIIDWIATKKAFRRKKEKDDNKNNVDGRID